MSDATGEDKSLAINQELDATQTTHEIRLPNAIVLKSDNKEIKISATYDISDVPQSLEGIVAKVIKKQTAEVNL